MFLCLVSVYTKCNIQERKNDDNSSNDKISQYFSVSNNCRLNDFFPLHDHISYYVLLASLHFERNNTEKYECTNAVQSDITFDQYP